MKQSLAHAFNAYKIKNPHKWLAKQRIAEKPHKTQWSGELFSVPEFEEALAIPMLQAVSECGIFFAVEQVKDGIVRIVIDMIGQDNVNIFSIENSRLIIIEAVAEPKLGIDIDLEGDVFTCCDPATCAFALHDSWLRNPDRTRAHKARKYLCNAVQRLLALSE